LVKVAGSTLGHEQTHDGSECGQPHNPALAADRKKPRPLKSAVRLSSSKEEIHPCLFMS